MPLAKSAVPAQPITVQTPVETKTIFINDGVPVDIARYFSIDPFAIDEKMKGKLRDIYGWSRDGVEDDTIGNNLQKISTLDRNLGTRMQDRTKVDRIWSWVILDKQIKELRKRQNAYEG